jgi:hypothetical protein
MVKINASQRQSMRGKAALPSALGDAITVRGKLALLGWPSVESWAKAHGYQRAMANYCIRTWGQRTDRQPHGGISRQLMRDLRETLATGRRPAPSTQGAR